MHDEHGDPGYKRVHRLLVPYQPKICQKKQENFHTGLEMLI
jgi:hypothetical protein